MRRRVGLDVSVVFLLAVGFGGGCAGPVPTAPPTMVPTAPNASTTDGCGATAIRHDAAPGGPGGVAGLPWARATPASFGVTAFFWSHGQTLTVRQDPGQFDKVLWVTDSPTQLPLQIEAFPLADPTERHNWTFAPAADPPGNYPSDLSLPVAGCWHFTLTIGGAQGSMDLLVAPA